MVLVILLLVAQMKSFIMQNRLASRENLPLTLPIEVADRVKSSLHGKSPTWQRSSYSARAHCIMRGAYGLAE